MNLSLQDSIALGQQLSPESTMEFYSNPAMFAMLEKFGDAFSTGNVDNATMALYADEITTILSQPRDETKTLTLEQTAKLQSLVHASTQFSASDYFAAIPHAENLTFHITEEQLSLAGANPASYFHTVARTHVGRNIPDMMVAYFESYPEEREDPVSEESLHNLQRVTMSNSECSVCLIVYPDPKEVVRLGCGHTFDELCILEWFKRKHTCPMCRFNVE
jgi:hypothetical protein